MSNTDVNPASSASLKEDLPPVLRPEHAEGNLARLIEQQTAKVPSHWFLFAAFTSMGLAIALEFSGRVRAGQFFGQWPTPLLVMGLYNKLVKMLGPR